MSPDNARRPQCETPFPYSKHSQTLSGQLDHIFRRVGLAVVVGGAFQTLLLFLAGGTYVYWRWGRSTQAAEQTTNVTTVVNDSFVAAATGPVAFQIAAPAGARDARLGGGYKVTAGPTVNCYIVEESQFRQLASGAKPARTLAAKENLTSVRLRQPLAAGSYYLVFAPAAGDAAKSTVAPEFYLKFN